MEYEAFRSSKMSNLYKATVLKKVGSWEVAGRRAGAAPSWRLSMVCVDSRGRIPSVDVHVLALHPALPHFQEEPLSLDSPSLLAAVQVLLGNPQGALPLVQEHASP